MTATVTSQMTLDVDPPEPAIVPCCARCGASGPPVEVDGIAAQDFGQAVKWALVSIGQHDEVCSARAEVST